MRLFRSKLPQSSKAAIPVHALAAALLVLTGPLAAAAGMPPHAGPALQVQFRQDGYGQDPYRQDQYRQEQYRQGPRGYDDPRDGYAPDRRGYDDQDRYGQGRRRQDDRADRYGQQGGGRGGSYQQSCTDIRQDGSVLSAVCGDGRGRRVESSIDVNRCGRGDIGNNRGYLQCGNVRGNGRPVN